MDPLRTLESLRSGALHDALLVLSGAQREHAARSAALRVAQQHRARALAALEAARAAFAGSLGAEALQWAEQTLRAAALDLVGANARLERVESAQAAAESALRAAEAQVLEQAAGQRAVGLVLEQRSAAELKHSEQQLEDEADDVFRARQR